MGESEFIAFNYMDNPKGYVSDVLKVEKIEPWQGKVLDAIASGETRIAVKSGHGIGKTALTSWVTHWFNATRPHPQGVVTANTKSQLETKTWRELAKWNKIARNGHWFDKTATKFALRGSEDTWFTAAIPWSENNSEAFAGTHEKHVLMIFDEASAIPNIIWEVAEGAMTTAGAVWLVFGNPTKNTGRFRECWGKFKHRWWGLAVDSREVSFTDKKQLEDWISDYGEDSDFVRVRVKGQFPRAGTTQFISTEVVHDCIKYECEDYEDFPKIFGVDLARFGDDQSVICIRQGRKVFDLIKWRNQDGMYSAGRIVEAIEEEDPQIVFIDGDGLGGPIIDRVRQLVDSELIFEVQNGLAADKAELYFNKRSEMWALTRDALKAKVDLPNDVELEADLTGPEYGFDPKNRIQIEGKKDMKKRGLNSPDCADALIMTYAKPVMKTPEKERQFTGGPVGGAGWMG